MRGRQPLQHILEQPITYLPVGLGGPDLSKLSRPPSEESKDAGVLEEIRRGHHVGSVGPTPGALGRILAHSGRILDCMNMSILMNMYR